MLRVDDEAIDAKFAANRSAKRSGGAGDGAIRGGESPSRDARRCVGIERVRVEGKRLHLGSDGEEDERILGAMRERGGRRR